MFMSIGKLVLRRLSSIKQSSKLSTENFEIMKNLLQNYWYVVEVVDWPKLWDGSVWIFCWRPLFYSPLIKCFMGPRCNNSPWTWKISFQLGVFYLLVGERNNIFCELYQRWFSTVWKKQLDRMKKYLRFYNWLFARVIESTSKSNMGAQDLHLITLLSKSLENINPKSKKKIDVHTCSFTEVSNMY